MKNKKQIVAVIVCIALLFVPPLAHAKRKSYWARGMGIGAGVGGGIGIVAGFAACKESNADSMLENCDSGGAAPLVGLATGVGVALLGAGIGAGIGVLIRKKPKVSASPAIITSPDGSLVGGGLGITGNF